MFTQSDLTVLETALAQGTRKVTFSDGRAVEYTSFDELVKAISYVRQSLGLESASTKLLAKFSKGVQT